MHIRRPATRITRPVWTTAWFWRSPNHLVCVQRGNFVIGVSAYVAWYATWLLELRVEHTVYRLSGTTDDGVLGWADCVLLAIFLLSSMCFAWIVSRVQWQRLQRALIER